MTSTWPWLDHLVSGLPHRTLALFRLAFAPAPHPLLNLARHGNSPVHSTKGTPSPLNGLRLLVGIRFQVLFHSPPGVLFTFPSRYSSAIGHVLVFRLAGWSRLIPTGFLVPRRTQDPAASLPRFAYGALTLSGRPSHAVPLRFRSSSAVLLPRPSGRFGLLRFRSPLLAESLLFSFPPGTQMFHFPGFSSLSGCIPIAGCGFPHSDTAGSSLSYSSPARFAVRCVLLLRHVPRHPPYALSILISASSPTPAFAPISLPSLLRTFFSFRTVSRSILQSSYRKIMSFLYLFLLSSGFQRSTP